MGCDLFAFLRLGLVAQCIRDAGQHATGKQRHADACAAHRRHPRSGTHAAGKVPRKHFLRELNGKTGAGVYIWPSLEAAQKAHNEEWRQSIIKRTGAAPTIRYFDLLLLVDNEKGAITEFPAAAEIKPAAA
jgi:hypothetical protein